MQGRKRIEDGRGKKGGGALTSSASRMRPSDCGSSPSHEMENDRNNSQQQENVNKERGDVEHKEASQPQEQQNQSET